MIRYSGSLGLSPGHSTLRRFAHGESAIILLFLGVLQLTQEHATPRPSLDEGKKCILT